MKNLNIAILALLVLEALSASNGKEEKETIEDIQVKLKAIDAKIQRLTPMRSTINLKFSRLFETSFHNRTLQSTLDKTLLLPAVNLPYRDNFHYPILLAQNSHFYTLKGDLILAPLNKSFLISTARTQYTFFGQSLHPDNFTITKLKVVSRQIQVQPLTSIDISNINMQVSHFFVIGHSSGHPNFILADAQKGSILLFDKHRQFQTKWQAGSPIKQMDKIYHNIVVLTQETMFFLSTGRNINRTQCTLPEGGIDYFLFQDSTYQFVYGVRQGYVYTYNLGTNCRPIKSYHIPINSTLYLASNLLFVDSSSGRFVLNLTDSQLSHYNLPISQCSGQSKQSVIRKMQSQYIISRMCLADNIIVISHILLDLESEHQEIFDFSKFRIPLLLFSFGVIIYVTVNNKKREKAVEEEEKLFKQALMGQLGHLADNGHPGPPKKINYQSINKQFSRKSIPNMYKIKQK